MLEETFKEFFKAAKTKEKASEQFKSLLKKRVEWVANKCWPINLKASIKEVNEIIEAGREMEVTTAVIFSEEEIEALVKVLFPLRVLEMNAHVQGIVTAALYEKGIHHEFFVE